MNGRSIRPDQIAKEMEKAIVQKANDSIKKKVESVRCPEHGQYARVTVGGGQSLKGLKLSVSGCCEALVEEVKRRFR